MTSSTEPNVLVTGTGKRAKGVDGTQSKERGETEVYSSKREANFL